MTRVIAATSPSLYLRMCAALHHTLDHLDHFAGHALGVEHIMIAGAVALVALTHRHSH